MDSEVGLEKQSVEEQEKTGKYGQSPTRDDEVQT